MLEKIDKFLNTTTMFRLLTYYLGGLLFVSFIFSAAHVLPFDAIDLVAQTFFLIAVCWLSNSIFARIWNVPVNAESALITALILALIISPVKPDVGFFFLLWAGTLSMASKYILTIKGKHIFNPAAFGVAATALFLNQAATWWVGGNLPLLPFVIAGGFLVVRKIHRTDLVAAYLLAAIGSSLAFVTLTTTEIYNVLQITLLHTPLFFFAFVMLTEPLTTPPRRMGRMSYGALVGVLSAPWAHIGSVYFTPELALLAGNIFSYIVSPKFKAVLWLKEIKEVALDTYEFVFEGRLPNFQPGQYAEWTIKADKSDARGNRRYFTLASSPTEKDVRLGIKFYSSPSTYKFHLSEFREGFPILAGSIAGDFTLPRNADKRLVFIAGGIGVTPFRSMVKYLTDKKEKRDVVLMYSNKSEGEIAYKDVFDAAVNAGIGFRTVYTITDKAVSPAWQGEKGYIDAAMIMRTVPDYRERTFYISGPRSMVEAFKKTLRGLGVPRYRIRTDYFPGFA